MKKINFPVVALLALFIAPPAGAQVSVGITGGLNLATLNGKDIDGSKIDFSGRTVFGIGGVLDIGLNENVALRIEPMYLQKGAKFHSEDQDLGNIDVISKADYLEIPVFLKIALGTNSARPYLFTGPSIGFNLSSKFAIEVPGLSVEADIKEVTKSIDFGLGFGGGLSFSMGNNTIFLEGRYTLGLTDIVDDGTFEFEGEQSELQADLKTRGFQIMGGVTFPLSRK